jgi:hypothetical protein
MFPRTGEGAGGEGANMGGIPQVGFIPTGADLGEEETPTRTSELLVRMSWK